MKVSRRASRLAVRYFDDRVLLSDTEAWAYFRLPTISYEFSTPEEREALATNITIALAAIRMNDAEVHLRIAHRTYPAVEWATRLDETSDSGPGWYEYLDEMYRHVWAKDFWTKEVYLGVRLGQRGVRAQLSQGMFAQLLGLYQRTEHMLGLEDDAVDDREIARWTAQAERLGRHSPPALCAPATPGPANSRGCSATPSPPPLKNPESRLWDAAAGDAAKSKRSSTESSTTGAPICAWNSPVGKPTSPTCHSPAFPT